LFIALPLKRVWLKWLRCVLGTPRHAKWLHRSHREFEQAPLAVFALGQSARSSKNGCLGSRSLCDHFLQCAEFKE
jgi:hypothetical protein